LYTIYDADSFFLLTFFDIELFTPEGYDIFVYRKVDLTKLKGMSDSRKSGFRKLDLLSLAMPIEAGFYPDRWDPIMSIF
jgi:hypothetical protein